MPIARHFISCPGSPLEWEYINFTKWHRATNLLSLGLHHYNAFLFQSCIYLLFTRKHHSFTKSFSFHFTTLCLMMYFHCCFCLFMLKKKKLTNKKPCQTFILEGTKNKTTRVNLMKTPWSVQLWLNIWHFGQTHHFLFLSSQSKMIARIVIWILNTGWKQPLLTWHS